MTKHRPPEADRGRCLTGARRVAERGLGGLPPPGVGPLSMLRPFYTRHFGELGPANIRR
jgi:hypothetical protein